MIEMGLGPELLSLRLYGSYARGDHDELSDIDVLAIYGHRPTADFQMALREHLTRRFGRNVDLAEYSSQRIEEFFRKGHLFAWHLYSESRALQNEWNDFFLTLGTPRPYSAAASDARGFLDLLRSTTHEALKPGVSLVYEAGLMYLASRNVAICTSYLMDGRPDFSRLALWNLCDRVGVDVGIDLNVYRKLMHCRFASIRGHRADEPSLSEINRGVEALAHACEVIIERICGRVPQ